MHRRAVASLPTTDERSPTKPLVRRTRKAPTVGLFAKLWPYVTALMVMLLLLWWYIGNRFLPTHLSTSIDPLRRPLFVPLEPLDASTSTRCKHSFLNREKLDKSLALGTKFLSDHQRDAGNFDYEYDWRTGIHVNDDMEVRQAGALWGMSLIFHDMMDAAQIEGILQSGIWRDANTKSHQVLTETAAKVKKAIHFFRMHSKVLLRRREVAGSSEGALTRMRYITYPGEAEHGTGTQALVCLALIDFLRALGSPSDALAAGVTKSELEDFRALLGELLPFLVTQHSSMDRDRFRAWDELVEDGKLVLSSGMWYGGGDDDAMVAWWLEHQDVKGYFHKAYDEFGSRSGSASPYYDGESLLAVTKVAKYFGPAYVHLWPFAAGTARALHQLHVVDALKKDEDSDKTKGVYQWLSMSLFELATVTFGKGDHFDLPAALENTYDANQFGRWLVEMALWMVDVHKTATRSKNTGYAYEGIVPAWAWASHVAQRGVNDGMVDTARKLQCTIEKGLDKLISWQVGMGAEKRPDVIAWDGARGLGGVQNSHDESGLRIDVTQHQMHAIILTRRLVYTQMEAPWPWENVVVASAGNLEEQ